MPEIVLHYIWEYCLWAGYPQETTDGRPIEIISVGRHNRDAGPDYSGARIRIDGQEWVGNVEIHVQSSDWYRHRHDFDKAYDHVILHVVRKADKPVYNSVGAPIVQCELRYPDEKDYLTQMLLKAKQMDTAAYRIGCARQLLEEPELLSEGWRSVMLRKRLECKKASIERLLAITKNSWSDALYISLARNFGFHTNSLPFEQLAIATPLSYLQKHRNSLFQLTAMLLGQSGLPIDDEKTAKEYAFLKAKFGLVPINGASWKHARLRPQNSPETRIRQFAMLLHKSEFLLSKILDTDDLSALVELFKPSGMGRDSIDILLINTVLPYKYAYSCLRKSGNPPLSGVMSGDGLRVTGDVPRLMAQIAPENNTIIRQWKMLGQEVRSAADTQALLHLYQNYCQHHECINCEVGYQIFINFENESS